MPYVCSCRFSKNYFIPKFNLHTDFQGDQLSEGLLLVLKERFASSEDCQKILQDLRNEKARRKVLAYESAKRTLTIKQGYNKLYPHLFTLKEEFFHNEFLQIVEAAKAPNCDRATLIAKMETCCDHVWRFPVFNVDFCQKFVGEMSHFEKSDMPKGRPNTMNNYGILLDELGFDEQFFDIMRKHYILPIARILLADWVGDELDSHKVFTVKYKTGEDLDLPFHFDNAEVTLNVCLGKDFEGGSLYFGKMRTEPLDLMQTTEVKHKPGYGLLHRGQHRHGALEIEGDSSERHNLIIWMRSSSVRNKLCPMCDQKPDLVFQEGSGDGFTATIEKQGKDTESLCQVL